MLGDFHVDFATVLPKTILCWIVYITVFFILFFLLAFYLFFEMFVWSSVLADGYF